MKRYKFKNRFYEILGFVGLFVFVEIGVFASYLWALDRA